NSWRCVVKLVASIVSEPITGEPAGGSTTAPEIGGTSNAGTPAKKPGVATVNAHVTRWPTQTPPFGVISTLTRGAGSTSAADAVENRSKSTTHLMAKAPLSLSSAPGTQTSIAESRLDSFARGAARARATFRHPGHRHRRLRFLGLS